MNDPGPGTWSWNTTDDARVDGNGDRWTTDRSNVVLYKNGIGATPSSSSIGGYIYDGLAGVTGDYIYIKGYVLLDINQTKSYKVFRAALSDTSSWINVLDRNLDTEVAANNKAVYYDSTTGNVVIVDLAAITSNSYAVDNGGGLDQTCYGPNYTQSIFLSRDGKNIFLVKYYVAKFGSCYYPGAQQLFQFDGTKLTFAVTLNNFTAGMMAMDHYGEYIIKLINQYSSNLNGMGSFTSQYYSSINKEWIKGWINGVIIRGSNSNTSGIGRNSNRGYMKLSTDGMSCVHYTGSSSGPCGHEYYYYTWVFRPIPPIKVKAGLNGASVSLTWPAVMEATSYKVYKNGNYVASVASPGFVDPAGGTDYKVTAVNSAGESDATPASINIPPVLEVVSPSPGQRFGGSTTSLVPSVRVSDSGGDTLTLNYYIDSEGGPRDTKIISNTATAQLVSFTNLNLGGLAEGVHTLRFTAYDGSNQVERSGSIIIDRSPPNLGYVQFTSTDTAIEIGGSASDPVSGLDGSPYRYTVGAEVSAWTASNYYAKGSLMPNMAYYARFEARDSLGQAAIREEQVYTKAQIPGLSLYQRSDTSLGIVLSDSNPSDTPYQLIAGGQYVSQSGALTGSPQWITLTNKAINIIGLSPNTSYAVQAKALNNAGSETSWSQQLQHVTLPGAPVHGGTDISQRSIRVAWNAEPGISGYDIEVDGIVVDNGASNAFLHSGLAPETSHTYRARAKNVGGVGGWSGVLTVTTLPDPPPTPGSMSTTPTQTEVTVTWDITPKTTGYELEVDGMIVVNGNINSYIHRGLEPLTDHTYRVRATNSGGASPWSAVVVQKTLPYPPNTPVQFIGKPLIHDVTLTWDAAEGADAYEVESDGFIVENGNATTYIHDGLLALTGHSYRVRAKNAGGKSAWSERLNITTHPEKPITPGNVLITSDETSINVMWYKVPHAESYDVELDGASMVNVPGIQYLHEALTPDSRHTYRVRAKNISGDSPWSRSVTMITLPAGRETDMALTNIVAVVTNHYITLSWDTVAPQAQYDIEVDGQLFDNGKNTIYHHTGLLANEFHTYKIRLKSETGEGNWIGILSLSTLPDPPDAPTEVEAFANNNSIELRWQRITGSDGYDVEVDGMTIGVTDTRYLHIPLVPGTAHTYRVRAKNITGVTAWSPAIVKSTTSPTYKVNAKTDHTFELSLLGANVQDFSEVTFVVTFDPNQLDVMDLYTFTPQPDTNLSGRIPGSNLEVTQTQGKITYRIQQNIVPGTSWSGEVATILFKSKVDAEVAMDVVVE
jgi:hypothetical protein